MRIATRKIRFIAAFGLVSAAAISTAVAAPAHGQEARRQFDIPAQPLASALIEFSRQSDAVVTAPSRLTRDKQARAIRGSYSNKQALDLLLQGSGLEARPVNDGSWIVMAGTSALGREDARVESAAVAEVPTEEIVVTGSHIRGSGAAVGSQTISINRREIERAGHATVRDILESLPQNFGGGATAEYQTNAASINNISRGTSVNLRGLGHVATLTLVNGRRIAGTGFDSSISDVSTIPLAAIERVEIVPDGASAVYGSDAVGGVVNFILRKNFEGLETAARYGAATQGSMQERQASLVGGTTWAGGGMIGTYEFYDSDALARSERSFLKSADLSRFGGADYRAPVGHPANIFDPTTFQIGYAIPPGQNGVGLTRDDLLGPEGTNFLDVGQTMDILPATRRHSLYTYATHEISPNVKAFIEARFTKRDGSFATNPFATVIVLPSTNPYYIDAFENGEPLFLGYSFPENQVQYTSQRALGIATGLEISHRGDWSTEAFVSLARDRSRIRRSNQVNAEALNEALTSFNPIAVFNPFADASFGGARTPDGILFDAIASLRGATTEASAISSGTLFHLWANPVRAAIGVSYRRDAFESRNDTQSASATPVTELRRKVLAFFGELHLPLVSPQAEVPLLHRFELSASLRHDKYEDQVLLPIRRDKDERSTTNPRIGALWSPVAGLKVRGSYGTSFRAPGLHARSQSTRLSSALVLDPASPTSFLNVLSLSGTGDLMNEIATTWSVGAEVEPKQIRNLSAQINYFNVKFNNRIGSPPVGISSILSDPAYSFIVTRDPSVSDVGRACSVADELSIPADQCTTPGLFDLIVDLRDRNIARTHTDGLDATLSYTFEPKGLGRIALNLNGVYTLSYKEAPAPGAMATERVDTATYPVDFRARAGVSWSPAEAWLISSYVNYTDSYRDIRRNREVDSWTTADLTIAYRPGAAGARGVLTDTSFQLSAFNLFASEPPFYENADFGMGYDGANAEPRGRFVALSFTKKW